MQIACIWEHNGNDTLLYARDYIGAFSRGATVETALAQMPREVAAWLRWRDQRVPEILTTQIVQEKQSELQIYDADSDVLFDAEKRPLEREEYERLKQLALESARDFHALWQQIPDPNQSVLAMRQTFYGAVPRTANEMYAHTKNVNAYYFAEIGVDTNNAGTIWECRQNGFAELEKQPDFLKSCVFVGSYSEEWTLRKVLRRFVWHDRIHAKAMYRMAVQTFGMAAVADVFRFEA